MLNCHLEYDYDLTPEDSGYVHEDNLPNLEHMRDHLKGVLEALYSTGDMKRMESCLEEICDQLGVPMGTGDAVVEKKSKLSWYLGYQRCQLDQMNWSKSYQS